MDAPDFERHRIYHSETLANPDAPREARMMLKTRLTLLPGANGTKKQVTQYGDRLVCVRYRYDAENGRRLKTVELIEEEAPWLEPGGVYLVKIGYDETSLREQLKEAGARWEPQQRVWKTTGAAVRRLRLEERVLRWDRSE